MEQIKEEEMLKFPPRQQQPSKSPGQMEQEEETHGQSEIDVQKPEFQELHASPSGAGNDRDKKLEMLMGINLPISVELGRTNLEIRNIITLKRGSIIEFDKTAGEPVDIVINGKKMAEGEIVVIDKHFAVRVTSLVEPSERIRGLGK